MQSHKNFTRNKYHQGFTLLEVLIIVVLIGIFSTLGLFITIDFYKSYSFKAELNTVVSLLHKARADSLNNNNQTNHGLHIDSIQKKYILYEGDRYDTVGKNNQEYGMGVDIKVQGSLDINFVQLSGEVLNAGAVIFSDGKRSRTITINVLGQINW